MKAPIAPFTMKLRSSVKKHGPAMLPTAPIRRPKKCARAHPASTVIAPRLKPIVLVPRTGRNKAIRDVPAVDMDPSMNTEINTSAQIIEDIFDGVLSDITESDDEDSGGGTFSSASGKSTPVIAGNPVSPAPITPQNSFDGPSSTVCRAPRKSRHPRGPRSGSTPTRPKLARRSPAHRQRSVEISIAQTTDLDNATPFESFHLGVIVPHIIGASASDPDDIFRRECMNLANKRDLVNDEISRFKEGASAGTPEPISAHDTAATFSAGKLTGPNGTEIWDESGSTFHWNIQSPSENADSLTPN